MSKLAISLVVILALFIEGSVCRVVNGKNEGNSEIKGVVLGPDTYRDGDKSGNLTTYKVFDINSEGLINNNINASTNKNTSNEAPDKFVTAGSRTGVTQYPWVVYLEAKIYESLEERWNKQYIPYACGGSLISSRHVITAAHCLYYPYIEEIDIFLGEYNTATFPIDCVGSKCVQNILMHPDKIVLHRGYQSSDGQRDDIAIMRLRGHAPNNGYIRPIPLATFDINAAWYEGTTLVVTGWGLTERGQTSPIKLHTKVQLMAPAYTCGEFQMHKGMLCAFGKHGRDSCGGDSGGPVMLEHVGNYHLVGLVSFGPLDCGSAPAVYTNVYDYLKWIKNHTRDMYDDNNEIIVTA